MKIIDIEQGSQEWLDFRKKHIGASDASIILGVSPWTTPFQLWRQKLDLDLPQEENEAMRYGKQNEEKCRIFSETLYGCNLTPLVAQSEEYPWLIASYDAYSTDFDIAIEIKNSGIKDHEIAKKGLIPDKYKPQLLQQMIVASLDRITYQSCYKDENVYVHISIDDFKKNIAEHLKKTKEFYDCMITLTQPELYDRDYLDMSMNNNWINKAIDYRHAKEKFKMWEKEEQRLKDELIKISEEKNCKGYGIKLSKITKKGNILYNEIPELQDVDLEKYRKQPIEYWKVSNEN